MSKVRVQAGQTLADIALRYCGSLESLFALATLNELPVTAALHAGHELQLPLATDRRAVRILEEGGAQPAANLDDAGREGIGYWTIGENFTVS
jgi:hypothetical protein